MPRPLPTALSLAVVALAACAEPPELPAPPPTPVAIRPPAPVAVVQPPAVVDAAPVAPPTLPVPVARPKGGTVKRADVAEVKEWAKKKD